MSDTSARYAMILAWSDDDEAFIVTTPDLPDCRTHGDRYAETARKGAAIMDGRLKTPATRGLPTPPACSTSIGDYFDPLDRLAGVTPPLPSSASPTSEKVVTR